MGRYDEGSAGPFPGLRKEVMRACFHTPGKYCVRRAALNIAMRRDAVHCGRCFRALFGIQFGSGALPTLRPRMASWTAAGLVNLGSLAGAKEYARSAWSTISITAGSDRSFTGWNGASRLSTRNLAFSEFDRAIPTGVTRGGEGVGTLIIHLGIFHSDWSTGSRLSTLPLHWSFRYSSRWWVTDRWRQLISTFRAGFLVISHCLLNRFFRRMSSWIRAGIADRGSSRCWLLRTDAARASGQFLYTLVDLYLVW